MGFLFGFVLGVAVLFLCLGVLGSVVISALFGLINLICGSSDN